MILEAHLGRHQGAFRGRRIMLIRCPHMRPIRRIWGDMILEAHLGRYDSGGAFGATSGRIELMMFWIYSNMLGILPPSSEHHQIYSDPMLLDPRRCEYHQTWSMIIRISSNIFRLSAVPHNMIIIKYIQWWSKHDWWSSYEHNWTSNIFNDYQFIVDHHQASW
jgi:hypothetical protein